MDVTFTAHSALQTHALAALRFPLLVSADGTAPVPVLRLLRTPCTSADAAAGTPADIFVTSSSRIVELHVQAWGDGTLSYAQTLRGTPGPAVPAAAIDDGAPSCASAGSGGTQAFVARIPASQAYPDWRVLQLRFASTRGAAGGVCTVYDIRTTPGGASVAPAASPSTAEGARASGAAAAAVGSATSTVSAGAVNSPAAEHAAVPELPAPEVDGFGAPSSSSSYGTAAEGVAAAVAPPQAVGSQMQQLRELLQRAAAAVPPAGASVSAAAAAAASASSSSESASLRPSHGSASAAVPSAARANLGLAATLARSLLQAQMPPPANAAATATAQAHPPSRGDGRDPCSATAWPAAQGLGPMGDGGGLSGPGPVAGGAGGGSGAPAAAAAGAAESPEGCVQPRDSLSSSLGAGLGQASPLPQQPHLRVGGAPAAAAAAVSGGGGGGFPSFPLPGFLPGPLAAAAAQLADVSARVRRIEEHLMGPMGPGPAGPGAGAGADRGMGLRVGQQQQPGRGEQQQPHAELSSQPQQQGQQQGQERGQQQHQTPGQEQEEQQEQGRHGPTSTAATRAELPPLWAQLSKSDGDPPSALHPTSPSPHPPPQLPRNPPPNPPLPGLPLPGPLVEQLLAVLPALAAGMTRLEAAVAQQSAALSELTRQVADVQRRMDATGVPPAAAAEAAPAPALTLAPSGSG